VRIPFPQSHHDLYYNPEPDPGHGHRHGLDPLGHGPLALGLDQRFDLSHAYWLVAGIAGVDPHQATIGSAVWAHYLVDGDLAHEIDARNAGRLEERLFRAPFQGALDKRPQRRTRARCSRSTRAGRLGLWPDQDIALPDSPQLAAARAPYTGTPAQSPAPR
jgi:purine nucleoside permease